MYTKQEQLTTAQYDAAAKARRKQRIDDKLARCTTPKIVNVQNTLGWPPRKVQPKFVDSVKRWNREANFEHPILPKDRLANLAKWDSTHPFYMKYPQPFARPLRQRQVKVAAEQKKRVFLSPPSEKASRIPRRLRSHLVQTFRNRVDVMMSTFDAE